MRGEEQRQRQRAAGVEDIAFPTFASKGMTQIWATWPEQSNAGEEQRQRQRAAGVEDIAFPTFASKDMTQIWATWLGRALGEVG
jgi:hypothetical protein